LPYRDGGKIVVWNMKKKALYMGGIRTHVLLFEPYPFDLLGTSRSEFVGEEELGFARMNGPFVAALPLRLSQYQAENVPSESKGEEKGRLRG